MTRWSGCAGATKPRSRRRSGAGSSAAGFARRCSRGLAAGASAASSTDCPTRSPRVAAERIRAGLAEGVDAESLRALAARLSSPDPPPELIAVAEPEGDLVLVEGHLRLTAYALFPEYLPERLEILLGISERAAEWSCF